jgi:hypothetical protein
MRTAPFSNPWKALLGLKLPGCKFSLEFAEFAGGALYFFPFVDHAVVAPRTPGLFFPQAIDGGKNTDWKPDHEQYGGE